MGLNRIGYVWCPGGVWYMELINGIGGYFLRLSSSSSETVFCWCFSASRSLSDMHEIHNYRLNILYLRGESVTKAPVKMSGEIFRVEKQLEKYLELK